MMRRLGCTWQRDGRLRLAPKASAGRTLSGKEECRRRGRWPRCNPLWRRCFRGADGSSMAGAGATGTKLAAVTPRGTTAHTAESAADADDTASDVVNAPIGGIQIEAPETAQTKANASCFAGAHAICLAPCVVVASRSA
eukprot:TRINITY_DN31510_c1_g1_i2.p3 TRINITY_DN31510_c1_g1~~TRINITY_DN31510_c1_g1_i2.p3  ORF type:complete len:139 (+),score=12.89 TRINITY_DN31510_c1_g1_i2:451-867(+)